MTNCGDCQWFNIWTERCRRPKNEICPDLFDTTEEYERALMAQSEARIDEWELRQELEFNDQY